MRSRVFGVGVVCSLCLVFLLNSKEDLHSMSRSPDTRAALRDVKPERTFEFTYRAEIHDLPHGSKRVQIWIPVAATNANQKVRMKRVESAVLTRLTREPQYGNRMLYAEIQNPTQPSVVISIEYQVTRKEYSKGDYRGLMQYNGVSSHLSTDIERLLAPDRLVPIDGKIKRIADEVSKDQQGDVQKSHALYEYVFKSLRYDKSGTGWGRGDSLWACDAKRGNCTDFHSLFISLARAEHIPARFEIGFPIPEAAHEGPVSGYHCWAEFYLTGRGWVPVDISEAWKNPSKHDYFFGTLDANRIEFSQGRDLLLSPRQSGAPLNYFIYPYVEVDGFSHAKIENKFTFRDEQRGMSATR